MEELRRVFVALGLPPEHRMAVADWIDRAEVPGTVPPPENLHVTVRWFGDLEASVFDRLLAGMDGAHRPEPFVMRLDGVGVFPRPAAASVVWLRPEAPELEEVRQVVDGAAEDAGIPPDDRPFVPHLTVGRLRPPADLRPFLAGAPPVAFRVPVERMTVLRSRLGSGPPGYEVLDSIPLG